MAKNDTNPPKPKPDVANAIPQHKAMAMGKSVKQGDKRPSPGA